MPLRLPGKEVFVFKKINIEAERNASASM
jgi:hypothetical protein